jgi:hypothetical protein
LNDRRNQPRAFISGLAPGRAIAQLTESRIPPPPAHDLANRWRHIPSGRRSAHPLAAVACQTRWAGFFYRSAKGTPRPLARIRLQLQNPPPYARHARGTRRPTLARLMRPTVRRAPRRRHLQTRLERPDRTLGRVPSRRSGRLQPATTRSPDPQRHYPHRVAASWQSRLSKRLRCESDSLLRLVDSGPDFRVSRETSARSATHSNPKRSRGQDDCSRREPATARTPETTAFAVQLRPSVRLLRRHLARPLPSWFWRWLSGKVRRSERSDRDS